MLCLSAPGIRCPRQAELRCFCWRWKLFTNPAFPLIVALPPSPRFRLRSDCAVCEVLLVLSSPWILLLLLLRCLPGRAVLRPQRTSLRGYFLGKGTHGWAAGGLCCRHPAKRIPSQSGRRGINQRPTSGSELPHRCHPNPRPHQEEGKNPRTPLMWMPTSGLSALPVTPRLLPARLCPPPCS